MPRDFEFFHELYAARGGDYACKGTSVLIVRSLWRMCC
jgi:hypothetical protein